MSEIVDPDIREALAALQRRVDTLEQSNISNTRLGPQEPTAIELGAAARQVERFVEAARQKLVKADVPLVDRSARILVGGEPIPDDYSHTELKENGQQKDYVVLTAAERSKGFVRPYRNAYRHLKCGQITTMGRAIAETYARDPNFYTGTFCVTCGTHLPIGENGEFVWYEMDGSTGPKVGT